MSQDLPQAPKSKILLYAFFIYAVLSMTSMAMMSIGAALWVLALIYYFGSLSETGRALRTEFKRPETRTYLLISGILMMACALSSVSAIFFPLVVAGEGPHVHFPGDLLKLWYFLWPWLLVTGLREMDKKSKAQILRTWLITFGVISAIGVIQYFTGWPRPQFIPEHPNRYHATIFFGHHLSTASILIFPFFTALDLWRTKRSEVVLPKRILGLFVALGLLALIFTFSRTLLVALPCGVLVWGVWNLFRTRKSYAVILCGVLLGASALIYQVPSVHSRFNRGGGIWERKQLWETNWEFFKTRPWTGVGFRHNEELAGRLLEQRAKGDYFFAGHAHNNFLEMLAGTGSIGTLSFLLFCFFIFALTYRKTQRPDEDFPIYRGLFCAWIVFQLNGLTQVNFWDAKVMHQMFWCLSWTLL